MPPLAPLSTVPDFKEHYMLLLSFSSLLLLLLLVGVALCAEECEEEDNNEERTLGSAGGAGTSPGGGVSPRGSSGATTPLTPLPKQNQSRTPVAATSSSSNLGTSPKISSKNSNVKGGGGGGGGGKSSLPPSKQRASKLFGNRATSVPSSSAEDSDKSDRKMVSMLFNVLSKNKVKGISLYKGGKQKQQQQVTEGVAGGCRKF
ncbi:hypothetical protein TYRP_010389 [Tyrophagus putrescentiae]|nr:hypothetical protein TYRP_010389 [Tyrophagus putrescentiae]